MKRSLLFTACSILLWSGVACAHAHLQSSSPAKDASVPPTTKTVILNFTEAVQTKMSTFKVYPVKDGAAADQLFKTALATKNDQAARTDTKIETKGSSQTVVVDLKQPLPAGTYAVMWKVMASDDGHVTDGHFTFNVK